MTFSACKEYPVMSVMLHRWFHLLSQCFSWALKVYFRDILERNGLFFDSPLRQLSLDCMKAADTWSSRNLGRATIWPIRRFQIGGRSPRRRSRRRVSRRCCSSHRIEKNVIVAGVLWWYIAEALVVNTFHGNALRWAILRMAILVNIAVAVKETNSCFDLSTWNSGYLWDSLRSRVIFSYCGALGAWPGVDKRRQRPFVM